MRTLLHPRMQPFPKRREPELEQEIIRHAATVENPYLYLLSPEPKALPAPSIPLEDMDLSSLITSVATFGGEVSGGVSHRDAEGKIRNSFGGFTNTMQNALNPRMTSGFRGTPRGGGIQGDGDGGEEKKKQKDAKKNKQLVGDGADVSDRSESA